MWFLRSMDGEVQRSEEIGTVQEFKPVAEARTKQESSWASQRDSRAQRRHHGRRPVRIASSSNGKNLNTFSQDGSRPRGEKKRAVTCCVTSGGLPRTIFLLDESATGQHVKPNPYCEWAFRPRTRTVLLQTLSSVL